MKRGNFTAADLAGGEDIDDTAVIGARRSEEDVAIYGGADLADRHPARQPHDDPVDGDGQE